MGYSSHYRLYAKTKDPEVRKAIRRYRVYDDCILVRDLLRNRADDMKWYEWQDDMRKLSVQFPDVLFTLYRAGEESGDLEKGYFLGGKCQTTKARLRYDKFDPAKLR